MAAIAWLAVAMARVLSTLATARALATSQTLTSVSSVGSVWSARKAVARSAVEVMVRVCPAVRAALGSGPARVRAHPEPRTDPSGSSTCGTVCPQPTRCRDRGGTPRSTSSWPGPAVGAHGAPHPRSDRLGCGLRPSPIGPPERPAGPERMPSRASSPRSSLSSLIPEDPVDHGASPARGAQVVVDHLVRPARAVTEDGRDRGTLPGITRQLVAHSAGNERDRVAQAADPPPGPVESPVVGGRDQVGVPRRLQRGQGPRAAQSRHLAGVPQLEQLDGPLDVGEAAATELEMGVRVGAAWESLAV